MYTTSGTAAGTAPSSWCGDIAAVMRLPRHIIIPPYQPMTVRRMLTLLCWSKCAEKKCDFPFVCNHPNSPKVKLKILPITHFHSLYVLILILLCVVMVNYLLWEFKKRCNYSVLFYYSSFFLFDHQQSSCSLREGILCDDLMWKLLQWICRAMHTK